MASSDDEQEPKSGRGFAGLASMVSDVEEAVANVPKPQEASEPASSTRTIAQASSPSNGKESESDRKSVGVQAKPKKGSSAGGWIFLIVLASVAALIVGAWNNYNSSNSTYAANSSSSSTYASTASSSSATPAPSWKQPTAPAPVPARPTEQKPPTGRNNVFSRAQIRYCIAEGIRIEAGRAAMNDYSDSDVDKFNRYVDDYNSRCGEYRYLEGVLASARSDLEPFRSEILTEGRNRFARGSSIAATKTAPEPDATVEAIQRRLNELGYDAGSADGLMGARTRSAIVAFQKDTGVQVDGIANEALLQKALQQDVHDASRNTRTPTSPAHDPLFGSGATDPDLSGLSIAERQSIEAVCSSDKYTKGPAAYNACLSRQLATLSGQSARPDLSGLSIAERQSIEAVCSSDKYTKGPAAYNACLSRQLALLRN